MVSSRPHCILPLLHCLHFLLFNLLFPVPLRFLRAPIAKALGSEDELSFAHAPVDAAIDFGRHSLHPSVVPVHRKIKMVWLALLALQSHERACVFGMLREGFRQGQLCGRQFDGHGEIIARTERFIRNSYYIALRSGTAMTVHMWPVAFRKRRIPSRSITSVAVLTRGWHCRAAASAIAVSKYTATR